jgi:tripartite-type tricarboxylate transporter receptor subunit TctC
MQKAKYLITIFSILLLLLVGTSSAADYPSKPITIISPMAPGGGHDLVGRGFASVADKILGQPLAVVNKPGAAGMVGGLAQAQSAPDGYTIGVTSTNVNATLQWEIANGRKPSFTWQDFTPIAVFTISPTLIVVNSENPWKTLAEFIKDAKAKPGHYAFGSGGIYGMSHLPAEVFARAIGVKFRHVPYTGGGPTLSALVGKHIDFATQYPGPCLPLVQGNKLRALAVQSDKRIKAYPDVPTVKELQLDAEFSGWVGLVVPQKTPAPIVAKLREAAKKVAEDKSFIELIERSGDEVNFLVGDQMTRHWEAESAKFSKLMADLVKEASSK